VTSEEVATLNVLTSHVEDQQELGQSLLENPKPPDDGDEEEGEFFNVYYDDETGQFETEFYSTETAQYIALFMMLLSLPTASAQETHIEISLAVSNYMAALGWFMIALTTARAVYLAGNLIKAWIGVSSLIPVMCRFLMNEWTQTRAFFQQEWKDVKSGLITEYFHVTRVAGAFVVTEVENYKKIAKLGVILQGFPIVAGCLGAIISSIAFAFAKVSPSGLMYPQGWRGDVNRGGNFMGLFVTAGMLLLAPVMGITKVLRLFKPLTSLFQSVPSVAWFGNWIYEWLTGEKTFDSFPQTEQDLRELLKDAPESEELFREMDLVKHLMNLIAEGKPWTQTGQVPKRETVERKTANLKARIDEVRLRKIQEREDKKKSKGKGKNKYTKVSGQSDEEPSWSTSSSTSSSSSSDDSPKPPPEKDEGGGPTPPSLPPGFSVLEGDFKWPGLGTDDAKVIQDLLTPKVVVTPPPERPATDAPGFRLDDGEFVLPKIDVSEPIPGLTSEESEKHWTMLSLNVIKNYMKGSVPTQDEIDLVAEGSVQSETALVLERMVELGKQPGDLVGILAETETTKHGMRKTKKTIPFSKAKKEKLATNFVKGAVLKPQSYEHPTYWEFCKFTTLRFVYDFIYKFDVIGPAIPEEMGGLLPTKPSKQHKMVTRQKNIVTADKIICKEVKRKWKKYKGTLLAILLLLSAAAVTPLALNKLYDEAGRGGENKPENVATPQSRKGRGIRRRVRGRRKFAQPSGGAEIEDIDENWEQEATYEEDAHDEDIYGPHYKGGRIRRPTEEEESGAGTFEDDKRHVRKERRANRQGIELTNVAPDVLLRQAIYASKKRTYRAPDNIADNLREESRVAFTDKLKLEKQAFQPTKLLGGVYKFFVDGRYACTATHVGSKLIVVLHVLSEDPNVTYTATNHLQTIQFKGSQAKLLNKELGYFPMSGHKAIFRVSDIRALKTANIVSLIGYGPGVEDDPDLRLGFASPLGWCDAKSENGDCSGPVLDIDGKIVGFWTHGDGKGFGRFEPVDDEMRTRLGQEKPTHVGLNFRSSPLSPQN
jgi:hypothetical protein